MSEGDWLLERQKHQASGCAACETCQAECLDHHISRLRLERNDYKHKYETLLDQTAKFVESKRKLQVKFQTALSERDEARLEARHLFWRHSQIPLHEEEKNEWLGRLPWLETDP